MNCPANSKRKPTRFNFKDSVFVLGISKGGLPETNSAYSGTLTQDHQILSRLKIIT